MKTGNRLLALTLAVVMLFTLLAGCGEKKEPTDGTAVEPGKTEPSTPGGTTPADTVGQEYVYTSKYSTLNLDAFVPEGASYSMSTLVHSGDRLYFTLYVYGSQPVTIDTIDVEVEGPNEEPVDEWYYRMQLCSMKDDGTDARVLDSYTPLEAPEGWEGSSNISALMPAEDGVVVVEQLSTYSYALPANFDPQIENEWDYYVEGENAWYLRRLDNTGAEISRVRVDELLEKPENDEYFYMYVNAVQSDKDGNIYLFIEQQVLVLNAAGEKLFQADAGTYVNSAVRLKDGSVGFTAYYGGDGGGMIVFAESARMATTSQSSAAAPEDIEGYCLFVVDPETQSIQAPILLSEDWLSQVYTGSGDYDLFYVLNNALRGIKLGEEPVQEELFNFINVDVDASNMAALIPEDDGTFRVLATTWEEGAERQICEVNTIYKVLRSELPQKTILTYACMYINYNVRRRIIAFNKQNDAYRIEVKDYSQYNTKDDYEAGLTKLTTEILSGQVPDLFSVSELPISRIAAKGYLEDLWPWIEQDADIGGREGVMTPILDALSVDGKLYQITDSASIYTLGGPTPLVGDKMGWTVEDLLAAYQQMPEGAAILGTGMTREDVLRSCLIMMQDDFVDWQTGRVSFDSEEFLNLMKFAALFPKDFDWEAYYGDGSDYVSDETRIMQGMQMLATINIYDLLEWRAYEEMMGGEMTFIGFPAGKDTVGSAFSINDGLAMSSTCKNKEGAWAFMRYLLDEDYQRNNTWSIPTNKKAFDEMLQEAMTDNYYDSYDEGKPVKVKEVKTSWWIDEDNRIELYAMTQEEADKVLDLINATTHIYQNDMTLWNIISDECAAFFEGQQTAEEAARLIQSRMNIYVNEQR